MKKLLFKIKSNLSNIKADFYPLDLEKQIDQLNLHIEKLNQDKNKLETILNKTKSSLMKQLETSRNLTNKISEQEEYYRIIINYGSDIIMLLDRRGKLFFVSEGVNNLLGYKAEEMVKLTPDAILHPEDVLKFKKVIKECLNSPGENIQFELRLKSIEGEWKNISAYGTNYLENSAVNGILLNLHDITYRNKIENLLVKSEERYRSIVENIPDPVIVHKDGTIYFVNSSAAKMLGSENPEQLIGLKIYQFIHPDFIEIVKKRIEETGRNTGQILSPQELKCISMDGSIINAESIITAITYEGENAFLSIFRDIGERKRIERLHEETEQMLKHDLKTPLNGIIGFSQLLLNHENLSQTNIQEWAATIYNGGKTMLHMINHSLDLFKMEMGKYQLSYEEINLIHLFDELEKELIPLQEEKSIVLIYKVNDDYLKWEENYTVWGQKLHLKTLFANLLKNAIEASPEERGITININYENNYFHEIDIHNWGVIPESVREIFFERYSSAGKSDGSGIGTYSAYLIARTHGGKITFKSFEDDGTHITVFLPKEIFSNSA